MNSTDEIYAAIRREQSVITTSVDLTFYDLSNMPYSAFWVQDFSVFQGNGYNQYEFHYYYDIDELNQRLSMIDDRVQTILTAIPANTDIWQTALLINDALCRQITYDNSSQNCHDLYGAIVEGRAVCVGYAEAYAHLMKKAGANYCRIVFSDNHAFNEMFVNDALYYVDCTWNDSDYTDSEGRPIVAHDYFFINSDELQRLQSHTIVNTAGFPCEDAGPLSFYDRFGYTLDSVDQDKIQWIINDQNNRGMNVFSFQFNNLEAYLVFKSISWSQWIFDLGLDSFDYWYNDELNTVNIYI